ncbi:hypothetical protein WICPIJ_008775 [Wickerhamomyces pijperi]|uniref:Uncharacterized protein n=1 Tax=Wickerhamomyces pijperi TaxID=599730 RepID=A0A9P8PV62_WICPI|nr:hypothetical protein WICPIJ_008775 [Wickerhamomyces pijperi]
MSKSLQYINDTYTGLSKLERLASIASQTPTATSTVQQNDVLEACLEAIECFDRYNVTSPDIEQIYLPKLKELSPIQFEDLLSSFWDKSLNARVDRKIAELNKSSYFSDSDIDRLMDLSRTHAFMKNYIAANEVLLSTNLGSKTCRLSELTAQIGILQGNYGLTFSQAKKIESFLSGCLNHEIYADKLTEEEIGYYFRIKTLIVFAHFLKKEFDEVVENTNKLLDLTIDSHSGVSISWLDILNSSEKFGKFINREEIISAYVVSLLMVCPKDQLRNITANDKFVAIVGKDRSLEFKPLFQSLSSADFKTLFATLDEQFHEISTINVFFRKIWGDVNLKLRYKAYGLYLSLIVRIDATHLSDRLDIDKTLLVKELKGYIKDKELEFEYKPEGDIFERIKVDKHQVFVNKLTAASEDLDVIRSNLEDNSDLLKSRLSSRVGKSSA